MGKSVESTEESLSMAKEASAKGGKPPAKGESAASLRGQIEKVDREIVKLIEQRAKAAALLAKSDHQNGQMTPFSVVDEQLARVAEWHRGPLPTECVKTVFRELISGSRALEKRTRVAYLGPQYSYSHVATIQRFGSSVDQVPVASIAAVFEEVIHGQADFGLVPLQNSTDGRIADTFDMFTRLRVRICGEVQLAIHHCLLARGTRSEISEVYSRPQALSQCRNWIAKHLPGAQTKEVTSTSTAAEIAQAKNNAAAIASAQAGVHYGLDVLAENIEDNPGNVTRFAVISGSSAERTGKDKTAAMFEAPDRPGSLADSMVIFKKSRINLSWIESFPITRPEGGYLFFIELDGHESDARVKKALSLLNKKSLRMEVLGSYPRSEIAG